MPSTRRSTRTTSGGPAQRGSQKTLAFTHNKVTKPSSSLPGKPLISSKPPTSSKLVKEIDAGHTTSETAVAEQAAVELERISQGENGEFKSAEEERASKVSDAQIKKYWRERENERMAARVHQEDLRVEEKILRLWDMSSQYGPCIGIARMKRWVRANKLGLNPPIEVLAVLLKEDERGDPKVERAYVDELSNKLCGVEG